MALNILVTGGAGKPRTPTGQFARTREPWSPMHWSDGYLDGKGRMRIYRPDYPRSFTQAGSRGYCFRAHIVWWLATGQTVPKDKQLHHKNHDRTDDRAENLEVLSFSEHQKRHRSTDTLRACTGCGDFFVLPAWRIRQGRGKWCSIRCYWAYGGRWNVTYQGKGAPS